MKYAALMLLASVSAVKIHDISAPHADDGLIDALTPPKGSCEPRLWIAVDEMDWQMDQFSRHFVKKNYENAMEIAGKLGKAPPRVHAWELMDAAFSFPRIRRYEYVQSNLDMLEHF